MPPSPRRRRMRYSPRTRGSGDGGAGGMAGGTELGRVLSMSYGGGRSPFGEVRPATSGRRRVKTVCGVARGAWLVYPAVTAAPTTFMRLVTSFAPRPLGETGAS